MGLCLQPTSCSSSGISLVTGSEIQVVGLNASFEPLHYDCLGGPCEISIVSDPCHLAQLPTPQSIALELSPGFPYTCELTLSFASATGQSLGTRTVRLQSVGDYSTLIVTPVSENGRLWGYYQKNLTDFAECNPVGVDGINNTADDEIGCVSAFDKFPYRVGPSTSPLCSLLNLGNGNDGRWSWNCTGGTLWVQRLPTAGVSNFIDPVTGTRFLPQTTIAQTALGDVALNLRACPNCDDTWENPFCELGNGKGHIIFTAGAYTYYPAGADIGDNDEYPDPPAGLDTCDNETTPYMVKVLRADQSTFYGYESAGRGQSYIGCKNIGNECVAPELQYVADAVVNPSNTGPNDTGVNDGGFVNLGFSFVFFDNFSLQGVDNTHRFRFGIRTNAGRYQSFSNLRIHCMAPTANSCAGAELNLSQSFLHALTVLEPRYFVIADETSLGLELNALRALRSLRHGIRVWTRGMGARVRVSNIHFSQRTTDFSGLTTFNLETNSSLVADNLWLSDNFIDSDSTGSIRIGAPPESTVRLHGLSISATSEDFAGGLWHLPDTTPIQVRAVTYVNTGHAFNIANSQVQGALFAWNSNRGLWANEQASLRDAIFHSNNRNPTQACPAGMSPDPDTGNEWCAEAGFNIDSVHIEPIAFTETQSTGASFAPPSLAQVEALLPFQSMSRFATDLASTLQGSCRNSGTCYLWDLSLQNVAQRARNYYSCSAENAAEILFDNIGNDDGVCDLNEQCMGLRNIGAYQGHGELIPWCPNGPFGTIWVHTHNGF